MKGTRRVHPELVCHLDLIVHVAGRLVCTDQGKERFWGLLRLLKELMSFRYPSNQIDESIAQPHEFGPVSIAWLGYPFRNIE